MSPKKDRAAAVSWCESIGSTHLVLELLQWMDSSVAARHEPMLASRTVAPQLHAILPIPRQKKQRSQLPLRLQDHKTVWKRLGRCRLCVSPGARNGHIPGRTIFSLQLQEMFHIVRI